MTEGSKEETNFPLAWDAEVDCESCGYSMIGIEAAAVFEQEGFSEDGMRAACVYWCRGCLEHHVANDGLGARLAFYLAPPQKPVESYFEISLASGGERP